MSENAPEPIIVKEAGPAPIPADGEPDLHGEEGIHTWGMWESSNLADNTIVRKCLHCDETEVAEIPPVPAEEEFPEAPDEDAEE